MSETPTEGRNQENQVKGPKLGGIIKILDETKIRSIARIMGITDSNHLARLVSSGLEISPLRDDIETVRDDIETVMRGIRAIEILDEDTESGI